LQNSENIEIFNYLVYNNSIYNNWGGIYVDLDLDFENQIKSVEVLYERLSDREKQYLKEALQIILTKFDERT